MRPPPNNLLIKPALNPSSPSKQHSTLTVQNLQRRQFSEQQTKKMLVLEQYFHNRSLNFDACNELIGSYVQAIEYFDRVEPSMRYYFLEKIQFVLSRPEVVDLLSGGQPNIARDTLNNLRDTLRGTVNQPPPAMENPVFSKMVSFKKDVQIEYNEEQKKKERSIKAQMYMDVQKEIKQKAPELRAEFRKLEKTEEQVKGILFNQNTEVERRRQMRKMKKKRNSLDKKKVQQIQEDNPPPSAVELKEMQKEVNDQIVRYTIRKTAREMEKLRHEQKKIPEVPENQDSKKQEKKQEVPQRPQFRQTKGGGRINIRQDDDDDD